MAPRMVLGELTAVTIEQHDCMSNKDDSGKMCQFNNVTDIASYSSEKETKAGKG